MRKITSLISFLLFLSCNKKTTEIGVEIDGKFDAEGNATIAKITQTKFGNGNVEDGKANDYVVSFNDDQIKSLEMSCSCSNPVLVNERDLNGDGIDEISIATVSNIDSIISLGTYSLANKRFEILLMSTVGVKKEIQQNQLQNFVVKDGNNIIQNSYFDGIIVNQKSGKTQNKIGKKIIKTESLN